MRKLIESMAHISKQIEIAQNLVDAHEAQLSNMIEHNQSGHVFPFTDDEIKKEMNSIFDYQRQVKKYAESLSKVVEQIKNL